MKKYTVKTIIDYINGNDIEGFTLEELENDMEFMKSAINYTNDKNMVAMCSEKIQNDSEFIKFIIYKFCHDIDFICKIADTFLATNDEEQTIDKYEVAIIMCTLITDKEKAFKYQLIATIAFQWEIQFIAQCKAEYGKSNPKLGEGFIFIMQDETKSSLMIEYFAKKFIDYILTLYEIDFESFLHKQFHSIKEVEQEKINSFLIRFLHSYDPALANYAKVHINILDSLKERVKLAIRNWDFYNKRDEEELYDFIFEKVYKYRQEHTDFILLEEDLLYSIGIELGVADKILKYYSQFDDDRTPSIIDKNELDFDEKVHYYAIKKLMSEILNGTYVEEDDYISNPSTLEGEVIAADFNNSTQKKG